MQGLETALRHKLLVGVCTSVCQSNLDDLVQDAWVDRLIDMADVLLVSHLSTCWTWSPIHNSL